MTFNGKPIKGKLHRMSFRTAIDNREDVPQAFIANHPNIDILSITTSFYSTTYGVGIRRKTMPNDLNLWEALFASSD